jgi:hypothetical protein
MNKFWKFFTKEVEVVKSHPVPEYIIFNLDNFNAWFNAKDNGAIYAHSGIFLRLDKLSVVHVDDYIEKCYGLAHSIQGHDKTVKFYNKIKEDWRKKLNEKHRKDKIEKKIGKNKH